MPITIQVPTELAATFMAEASRSNLNPQELGELLLAAGLELRVGKHAGSFEAVVTVDGQVSTHGPYVTLDQAGKMGWTWMNKGLRQYPLDTRPVATYRLREIGGGWLTRELRSNQRWVPDADERERRECARCAMTIVNVGSAWVVFDSVEFNGVVTCPPDASPTPKSMHTPLRRP